MSTHTPGPRHTLDTHRMHDGIYCTLVLPRFGGNAIARAFAPTARESKRTAVARARAALAKAKGQ